LNDIPVSILVKLCKLLSQIWLEAIDLKVRVVSGAQVGICLIFKLLEKEQILIFCEIRYGFE